MNLDFTDSLMTHIFKDIPISHSLDNVMATKQIFRSSSLLQTQKIQ